MKIQTLLLYVSFSIILLYSFSYADEEPQALTVSERLIAEVDVDTWDGSFRASPDSRHVASIAKEGNKQYMVVDDKKGRRYDEILAGALIFSPDSRRVTYSVFVDKSQFVVVDGKEGRQYESMTQFYPVFSPDSAHLAYVVSERDKSFLVVDEKEGRERGYDGIVTIGGAEIIFDSFDSLHYLAAKGNSVYLVEEALK